MTTTSLRILAVESGYRSTTNYASPVQKGYLMSGEPAITAMGIFNPGEDSSGTTSITTTTYLSSPTGGDTLTYYHGSGTNPVSVNVLSANFLEGTLAQTNTISLSPPGLEHTTTTGQLAIFTSNTSLTNLRKLGQVFNPIDSVRCFVIPFRGAEDPATFNFATGDTVIYTRSNNETGSVTLSAADIWGGDNGYTIQVVTFDTPLSLTNGDYISIAEPAERSILPTFIQNRRLPRLIN